MPSAVNQHLTALEEQLVSSLGSSRVPVSRETSIHRLVFAPAFDAPSLVEFQFGPSAAEVSLIISSGPLNTVTVGSWQGIEVLSAQLRDEVTTAAETMRPFDLPDLITSGRDGIAVRYRLISQGGRTGFDAFNPDVSDGRAQRDWLALILKIVREVFDDPKLERYFVGLSRHFVS